MPNDYNDETFINNLVDEYKRTESEALRNQLLKAFEPFFKKYSSLLCSNRNVDLANKDTLKFLRLFMSDEDRANDATLCEAAKRTLGYLRNIFKDCTPEDIYTEMVCLFLEQLYRYKPMIASNTPHKSRISFTHFSQVNIRYKLHHLTAKRAKDAMYAPHSCEFNDEIACEPVTETPNVGFGDHSIDLRWVRGMTTGDVFRQLEEYERYLLFLKYEDGDDKPLSDYDIARLTGQDRMYVRRKFLKIRDKLKVLVGAG